MAKYDLDTLRHSTAHLMAQAISRLFPEHHIQFGVGPVIDNGFYYDVETDYRIKDEDLPKIEAKMLEIIEEKLPIERKVLSKDEALDYFEKEKQHLKVELISGFDPEEEISCYSQGEVRYLFLRRIS